MASYDPGVEETRVDRWLWAVRLFKTRGLATDACKAGHVKVNGHPAKPATPVRPGDLVEAFAHDRHRVFEVVEAITKRVGAPIAAEAIVDHSPPPPPREFVAPALVRDAATGRPTKRDRRQIDRLRSR